MLAFSPQSILLTQPIRQTQKFYTVPVGAGAAFACKYRGDGGVCVTLYGDGASNQGQVYEAFNISKLWNLPVIFVCENNLYAMGTSFNRSTANPKYYTKGDIIPGIKVDGMDVLAMREVTKFAVDHAVNKGPIVLEALTYRYFGHSMSDPGYSYRKREEINEVRKSRDPITNFKDRIISANIVTNDDLKKIDDEVKKEVDSAVQLAKTDKEIDIKEIAYDVYALNLAGPVRNNLHWNPLEHKNIAKAINMK